MEHLNTFKEFSDKNETVINEGSSLRRAIGNLTTLKNKGTIKSWDVENGIVSIVLNDGSLIKCTNNDDLYVYPFRKI